jgi:rhodanese-related sulfurtransferase
MQNNAITNFRRIFKMKKRFGLLAALMMAVVTLSGCGAKEAELPGAWGEGATFKANECSITINPTLTNPEALPLKDFMNRADVRYFDLRDVSEGYGAGHIEGFESVSYFKVLVGDGNQLFTSDFSPRYNESVAILEATFPKDAHIFAMCAVGGRVTPFMNLLKTHGYDMSKCYNVGGWKQVDDTTGLAVSKTVAASKIEYDFSALTLKA